MAYNELDGLKGYGLQNAGSGLTLTNVTGTFAIGTDNAIALNKGIYYEIQFVGSSAADSCILNHNILAVNRSGTVTIVNDVAIRADYKPGGFSSTAISAVVNSSVNVVVTLTGLPAGTNGKVSIKRIRY